jgi:hypothetical protein
MRTVRGLATLACALDPHGGRRLAAAVGITRCGQPEPAIVDSTGRAVFVRAGGGVSAWSSAPVGRYTRP